MFKNTAKGVVALLNSIVDFVAVEVTSTPRPVAIAVVPANALASPFKVTALPDKFNFVAISARGTAVEVAVTVIAAEPVLLIVAVGIVAPVVNVPVYPQNLYKLSLGFLTPKAYKIG